MSAAKSQVWIAALLAFASLSGAAAQRCAADEPTAASKSSHAAELVRQALEAEAQGRDADRLALLRQALSHDPAFAPAHWHAGEVQTRDGWLSIGEAARRARDSGKVDEYRAQREQVPMTFDEQVGFARWCEANGLPEQQRLHLMQAFLVNPRTKSREVISKLGLVRYRNQLMTPEYAAALREQAARTEAALRVWKPRLERWKAEMEMRSPERREAARQELSQVRDPRAVPALEAVFARSNAEAMSLVVLTLAEMPEQEATDSLVRFAVFAPHGDAAVAAAHALSKRSMFAYVPALVGSMKAPLEVQWSRYLYDGAIASRVSVFREGPLVDEKFVSAHILAPNPLPTGSQEVEPGGYVLADPVPGAGIGNPLAIVAPAVRHSRIVQAAALENAVTEAANQRIAWVLRAATGQELAADPKLWWQWWSDYNEIGSDGDKPVYEQVSYARALYDAPYLSAQLGPRPAPPPSSLPPIRPRSCFVAGTPVWTMTGPMAIERIQPGELVLAQNPATGELAFKPVLLTTTRPATLVLLMKIGDETIRTTRGHPFWVSGAGWRMAKELQPGDRLHGAQRPAMLESIEPDGEAVCYNLHVGDFATYFVGSAALLVHDNTLREVTPATVPGLVER